MTNDIVDEREAPKKTCRCIQCVQWHPHYSDCGVHNDPIEPCDCPLDNTYIPDEVINMLDDPRARAALIHWRDKAVLEGRLNELEMLSRRLNHSAHENSPVLHMIRDQKYVIETALKQLSQEADHE